MIPYGSTGPHPDADAPTGEDLIDITTHSDPAPVFIAGRSTRHARVRCAYCDRLVDHDSDVCKGCGAPL